VDLTTCKTNDETGAGELKALWNDPDYQAGQKTAYYLRVLENPKCRWSTAAQSRYAGDLARSCLELCYLGAMITYFYKYASKTHANA